MYSVLYRGPLSSCNYACSYCPFSKRTENREQLQRDEQALRRFVDWLAAQTHHEWKILFTPWGEAMVRRWYRTAMAEMSHWTHLKSVSIQTNLSAGTGWLANCRSDRVSLWATYHPTEVEMRPFIRKVRSVCDRGVRISVGAVGVPEHLDQICRLRDELPRDVYLWVNAQQPRRRPYSDQELERFQQIDPHFQVTARPHPSLGRNCPAGETSFTVDGEGHMRRCHFVDNIIGNCHAPDWEQALQQRNCPNRFCNCYLGLSQFLQESLTPDFGPGLLERIPSRLEF